MIIIPEIQKVVILVPRTGSGSLRRAIQQRYPASMLIYRHMEADGIPAGYDRWEKVGVLRHPVERLWSLYKFIKNYKGPIDKPSDQGNQYVISLNQSAQLPFCEWIVQNQWPFTSPYDSAGSIDFWPLYNVRHALPENRKSQFLYLRPDLGTKIYPFELLHTLAADLDVLLPVGERQNTTTQGDWPLLTDTAMDYVKRVFEWDMRTYRNLHDPSFVLPRISA